MKTPSISSSSNKQRSTLNRSASLSKTSKPAKPTSEHESSEQRDRQRLTMGLRYEIEYNKQQECSTPWSSFVS
jgi:hypothetical protein